MIMRLAVTANATGTLTGTSSTGTNIAYMAALYPTSITNLDYSATGSDTNAYIWGLVGLNCFDAVDIDGYKMETMFESSDNFFAYRNSISNIIIKQFDHNNVSANIPREVYNVIDPNSGVSYIINTNITFNYAPIWDAVNNEANLAVDQEVNGDFEIIMTNGIWNNVLFNNSTTNTMQEILDRWNNKQ